MKKKRDDVKKLSDDSTRAGKEDIDSSSRKKSFSGCGMMKMMASRSVVSSHICEQHYLRQDVAHRGQTVQFKGSAQLRSGAVDAIFHCISLHRI